MDIPSKVYVTCAVADLKQVAGTLISISPNGYYEVNLKFGTNTHAMLLPIDQTSVVAQEPVLTPPPGFELER